MRNTYEPKYSKAAMVKKMIQEYGALTPLKDVFRIVLQNNIYECPKCSGRGYIKIRYNGYPNGLPDSGWVYEEAYRDDKCDLCKGIGYTSKPMKPKFKQVGWEEDE